MYACSDRLVHQIPCPIWSHHAKCHSCTSVWNLWTCSHLEFPVSYACKQKNQLNEETVHHFWCSSLHNVLNSVWYGILEFNVPLDTVWVISETGLISVTVFLPNLYSLCLTNQELIFSKCSHFWFHIAWVIKFVCTSTQPVLSFKLFVVILGKSHYMIYSLVTAMKPRMLVTFDKDFNPLPVSVRVGQVCCVE